MTIQYGDDNRIEALKGRARRCVCKFCGGELKVKNILFSDINEARIEIFCDHCGRIEYGVEREIYICARDFVDNFEFNMYEELDENEQTRRMNIAKVCDILGWGCKNMGFTTNDGFAVPVQLREGAWAEVLTMSSDEIDTTKDFDDYLEALS